MYDCFWGAVWTVKIININSNVTTNSNPNPWFSATPYRVAHVITLLCWKNTGLMITNYTTQKTWPAPTHFPGQDFWSLPCAPNHRWPLFSVRKISTGGSHFCDGGFLQGRGQLFDSSSRNTANMQRAIKDGEPRRQSHALVTTTIRRVLL